MVKYRVIKCSNQDSVSYIFWVVGGMGKIQIPIQQLEAQCPGLDIPSCRSGRLYYDVSIQRFSCEGAFWGHRGAPPFPSVRRHQGAQNGCSGLPVPPERSKRLFLPASVPPRAQKGSKRCKKAQKGSKRRSKRLFEPARCRQCARRGCSSLLRCRLCVRRGCSRLLFEITIRKYGARPHCALSHCTLLCFAPCMYMHGFTLVCIIYSSIFNIYIYIF